MKIRNGFISNSSSSSFIIFGKFIDFNNITVDQLNNREIFAFVREYPCEGYIGDYIDQETYNYLKSTDRYKKFSYIESKHNFDLDGLLVQTGLALDLSQFDVVGGVFDNASISYINGEYDYD